MLFSFLYLLAYMLSAPAVFDKGQMLGFIPYVICSSFLRGKGGLPYCSVYFVCQSLVLCIFHIWMQLQLFEEQFLISNSFSLHTVQLCSLPSAFFKVFFNSWQALVLFLLHGVFEVSLHLEKAFLPFAHFLFLFKIFFT